MYNTMLKKHSPDWRNNSFRKPGELKNLFKNWTFYAERTYFTVI